MSNQIFEVTLLDAESGVLEYLEVVALNLNDALIHMSQRRLPESATGITINLPETDEEPFEPPTVNNEVI